jgi:5-oxoprolinase (ATP-hydrolysing) subunit A
MKNEFYQQEYVHRQIDLNCDLAQAWGVYKLCEEEALLPYVSTVNIACGAHAGDPPSILKALKLAKERELSVGALVGYPDPQGFGMREIRLDNDELLAYISSQLGLLAGMAKNLGITLTHFRPHGALYYKCAADTIFAEQVAKAVSQFSSWIAFVGPSGNYLNIINDVAGIRTVGEVHLDRLYRKDGALQKSAPGRGASFEFCMAQAKSLIFQGKLIVEGGRRFRLPFKTIHLSMDRPFSVELAEAVASMIRGGPSTFDSLAKIENLQPLKDLVYPEGLSEAWSDR